MRSYELEKAYVRTSAISFPLFFTSACFLSFRVCFDGILHEGATEASVSLVEHTFEISAVRADCFWSALVMKWLWRFLYERERNAHSRLPVVYLQSERGDWILLINSARRSSQCCWAAWLDSVFREHGRLALQTISTSKREFKTCITFK